MPRVREGAQTTSSSTRGSRRAGRSRRPCRRARTKNEISCSAQRTAILRPVATLPVKTQTSMPASTSAGPDVAAALNDLGNTIRKEALKERSDERAAPRCDLARLKHDGVAREERRDERAERDQRPGSSTA